MDSRFEARFPAKLGVMITDLEHPQGPIPGHIADISGSGIRVALAAELAAGSIVKVEIAGSSLFGHVVYANTNGADFHVGIEITRVLFGENDLSRLLYAVVAEQMPSVAISK